MTDTEEAFRWSRSVSGVRAEVHVYNRGHQSPRFIFTHDSAPCHRANIVSREFDVSITVHLPWPADSSDRKPSGTCFGHARKSDS